jgi:hypothetical protein
MFAPESDCGRRTALVAHHGMSIWFATWHCQEGSAKISVERRMALKLLIF